MVFGQFLDKVLVLGRLFYRHLALDRRVHLASLGRHGQQHDLDYN